MKIRPGHCENLPSCEKLIHAIILADMEIAGFDAIKVAKIFLGLSLLYLSFGAGKIYINSKDIKLEVKQQLRLAQVNEDKDLINFFMKEMDKANIPIDEKKIRIFRGEAYISMRVIYEDSLDYFGIPVWNMKFVVEQETKNY